MKRIIAALATLLAVGCTQIDTGNVGVESTFGQVKEAALPGGVYQTFTKTVYEVSAKENVIELNDMKPKTADNVTLEDLDVNVYWKIVPGKAPKIMTTYAGDIVAGKDGAYLVGQGLVTRVARQAAYDAANKHHSSVAHTKRNEIGADTHKILQTKLDAEGGMFEITNVVVRNILTDRALEQSIKAAAEVEFKTRQKLQEKALAQAESDRLRVEAEGVARANSIIASSLTPSLLRMREIEATAQFAKAGTHTVLMGSATPLVQVK